jgi:hypothetical protein
MGGSFLKGGVVGFVCVLLVVLFGVGQPVGRPARAEAAVRASFARLPLSFVVNRGQLDRRVVFAVEQEHDELIVALSQFSRAYGAGF